MTLYGRKTLVKGVKEYLKIKLQEIRKYYPDWEYLEIGVDSDHIHLCTVMPPKYSASKVVETMKKNTSKSLRAKFIFLDKVYCDDKSVGEKGYFVPTVGINE
jgi:putative transposase